MKKIIFKLRKHAFLFLLSNSLAALIIIYCNFAVSLFSLLVSFSKKDFLDLLSFYFEQGISMLPLFTFGAMFISFIPYVISLLIIKRINRSPIWAYALGGFATSLFIYMFVLQGEGASYWFIIITMLTGISCGTFYGILDKKFNSPKLENKKENFD